MSSTFVDLVVLAKGHSHHIDLQCTNAAGQQLEYKQRAAWFSLHKHT